MLEITVTTQTQTEKLAKALAKIIQLPFFITLSGTLGAGKTTFSRSLIQTLGHEGNVKSPTFTIVESYELQDALIYHFDLYRIADVEELELMGIRDYFEKKALVLLEWPEHGESVLPEADIHCKILLQNSQRTFRLTAQTAKGRKILQALE